MAQRLESLVAWEKKHSSLTIDDWKLAAFHLAEEADAMDDFATTMATAVKDVAHWKKRYIHMRELLRETRSLLRDAKDRLELAGPKKIGANRLSRDDLLARGDFENAYELGHLEPLPEDTIFN